MNDTQNLCVGRALAYAFGPKSYYIGKQYPTNDSRVVNEVDPSSNELKIRNVHVTSMINLQVLIMGYRVSNVNDLIVLHLGSDVGIHGHSVNMYLYRMDDKVYIWYRNPWGYLRDDLIYKRKNRQHPMNVLRMYKAIQNSGFCFLEPQNTMPVMGPQSISEECRSRNNKIEFIISSCKMGACIAWSAIYSQAVLDWLKTVNNTSNMSCATFSLNLLKIDISQVSRDEALKRISIFSYGYWSECPVVPINLIIAIFKACPENAENIGDVVRAYDVFNTKPAKKGPKDLQNVRNFLDTARINSSEIQEAWKKDSGKLEIFMASRTRNSLQYSKIGRFIVRTTMILAACKLRENGLNVNFEPVHPCDERKETESDKEFSSNNGKGKASDDDILARTLKRNKDEQERKMLKRMREEKNKEIIDIVDSSDSEEDTISGSRKKQRSSFLSWFM